MKLITLLTIAFTSCFHLHALPQQRLTITGRVTDSLTSRPLSGATIRVAGQNHTTTSQQDGRFTIHSVVAGGTLECSHIGYNRQSIQFSGKTTDSVHFRLTRTTKSLEEVVVSTGYEMIPAERATGSFEHIGTELFNRSVGPDILSRLENITNSTLFDHRLYDVDRPSTPNLTIRGLSTIRAEARPLIILDNFPYDGDPALINPNDVESVTLLKDAAAASIWGARAGNGVIVVTTKKGKFEKPLSISFRSSFVSADKPYLFKDPSFFSSADYIELEQYLFKQGFYDWNITDPKYGALTPVVELLARVRSGQVDPTTAVQNIEALKKLDVRHDFLKHAYRRSLNQQYALSASGGNRVHAFNLSVGYDHNARHAVNSYMERFTAKATHQIKLGKKLDVNVDLLYSMRSDALQNTGYETIQLGTKPIYPYAQFADTHGNALPIAKDYGQGYVDTVGEGLLIDWNYYPLKELDNPPSITKLQDTRLTFDVNYRPIKSLNLSAQYMFQRSGEFYRDHQPEASYYARNLINRFTQINDGVAETIIPYGGILNLSDTRRGSQGLRGQVNFNKEWGPHMLVALAGVELREARSDYRRHLPIYGYYDYSLVHATTIDYRQTYPIYDGLAGNSRIPGNSGFSNSLHRFVSEYANFSYSYRSRYTLSGSARRDASNIFGVKQNQRWSPLWSVGGAWTISDERFYNWDALPRLKLRLTYGYSGNIDPSVSAKTIINYATGIPSNGLPYASAASIPNPELRWEKVNTINAALDFASKNHRISGSFEAYQKYTKDLLSDAYIDPTLGDLLVVKNSASTKGLGMDIRLNTVNTTGVLKWESTLLFSYNRTTIARYGVDRSSSNSLVTNALGINPVEGQVAYAMYSYPWAGLDAENGDPQGLLHGEMTKDYYAILDDIPLEQLVFHGSALPLYYGSFQQNFSYDNFILSFNIGYQFDYYFRRPSLSYYALFNQGEGHPDYRNRWIKPGDEERTNVPSMVYPANSGRDQFYQYAEINTLRGDHIRLNDIRLAYRVNTGHLNRFPVKTLQIALYASNLGLLWTANKEKIDPMYRYGIPRSRNYALNLSFTF